MVEFVDHIGKPIRLLYYPPYHSKYNPVERCWGILEQHGNGAELVDAQTMREWTKGMTWKGIHPIVELSRKAYEKGISLSKGAGHASRGGSIRTGSKATSVGYPDPPCLEGMRIIGNHLSCLLQQVCQAGRRFQTTPRGTDRNRMMQVTYRLAGPREGGAALPESKLNHIRLSPNHADIAFPGGIS